MFTTHKATGIFRFILKIATWFDKKRKDEYEPVKIWFIYNPFKMQIQSLRVVDISTNGRLYKHETKHMEQHARHGTCKFCLLVVWYCVRYGYKNSPFEIEARAAEVA